MLPVAACDGTSVVCRGLVDALARCRLELDSSLVREPVAAARAPSRDSGLDRAFVRISSTVWLGCSRSHLCRTAVPRYRNSRMILERLFRAWFRAARRAASPSMSLCGPGHGTTRDEHVTPLPPGATGICQLVYMSTDVLTLCDTA